MSTLVPERKSERASALSRIVRLLAVGSVLLALGRLRPGPGGPLSVSLLLPGSGPAELRALGLDSASEPIRVNQATTPGTSSPWHGLLDLADAEAGSGMHASVVLLAASRLMPERDRLPAGSLWAGACCGVRVEQSDADAGRFPAPYVASRDAISSALAGLAPGAASGWIPLGTCPADGAACDAPVFLVAALADGSLWLSPAVALQSTRGVGWAGEPFLAGLGQAAGGVREAAAAFVFTWQRSRWNQALDDAAALQGAVLLADETKERLRLLFAPQEIPGELLDEAEGLVAEELAALRTRLGGAAPIFVVGGGSTRGSPDAIWFAGGNALAARLLPSRAGGTLDAEQAAALLAGSRPAPTDRPGAAAGDPRQTLPWAAASFESLPGGTLAAR